MIAVAVLAVAFLVLVAAFWTVVGLWIRAISGRDVMDAFRPAAGDVAQAERDLGVA